jgi:HD-GYP domain-containing protein (c-di-GMP phosphodiesterase class II)
MMAGEQIPLGVRIVTLSDSIDAMTSERPYRKAMTLDQALREVIKCMASNSMPRLSGYS